jgi:UDP-glucose 4-epimerase
MTGAYVITGAAGFLGRHLVAELRRRGLPVVAVTRQAGSFPADVEAVRLSDYRETPIGHADTVIHLSECNDIAVVESQGEAYIEEVRSRIEALSRRKPKRFVYVSSAAVYGDSDSAPRKPDENVAPKSIYARAKYAGERLVLSRDGVVVRLSNLYGPGMSERTVFFDILGQRRQEGPVMIRDAGPLRDYLHVDDAARGLADIGQGTELGVFNLGTGTGTKADELARLLLSAAGEPERPVEAYRKEPGKSWLVVDPSATEAAFGWRANISLRDGARQLVMGVP